MMTTKEILDDIKEMMAKYPTEDDLIKAMIISIVVGTSFFIGLLLLIRGMTG